MSSFYNPSSSRYLQQTSKSLKEYREGNAHWDPKEIFACGYKSGINTIIDDRIEKQLISCIDAKKLEHALIQCEAKNKKEVWIVICSGSFAPIHKSHIQKVHTLQLWRTTFQTMLVTQH